MKASTSPRFQAAVCVSSSSRICASPGQVVLASEASAAWRLLETPKDRAPRNKINAVTRMAWSMNLLSRKQSIASFTNYKRANLWIFGIIAGNQHSDVRGANRRARLEPQDCYSGRE